MRCFGKRCTRTTGKRPIALSGKPWRTTPITAWNTVLSGQMVRCTGFPPWAASITPPRTPPTGCKASAWILPTANAPRRRYATVTPIWSGKSPSAPPSCPRQPGQGRIPGQHEPRNPHPVECDFGLTQILERDTLAPDQQDLLHKISEAGSSLLHIINDILDFSKIEAGQFQIDPAPFGLAALLTRLENCSRPPPSGKG